MNSNLPYIYSDFIWFAIDSCDYIAAFITAGQGPVPLPVLMNYSMNFDRDEEELADSLPQISQPLIMTPGGAVKSNTSLAERGIFVYDWPNDRWIGPDYPNLVEPEYDYSLIAAPSRPLKFDKITVHSYDFIKIVRFSDICFQHVRGINVQKRIECLLAV